MVSSNPETSRNAHREGDERGELEGERFRDWQTRDGAKEARHKRGGAGLSALCAKPELRRWGALARGQTADTKRCAANQIHVGRPVMHSRRVQPRWREGREGVHRNEQGARGHRTGRGKRFAPADRSRGAESERRERGAASVSRSNSKPHRK